MFAATIYKADYVNHKHINDVKVKDAKEFRIWLWT